MAFSGIAQYSNLLRQAAIGVTTGDGPYDLTLTNDRVQLGMIDFNDNDEFYDDIPINGPYLKIMFPETTGIENVTAFSAQKLYQIQCELYVSLLKPRNNNLLLNSTNFTSDSWLNADGNVSTAHKLTDPSATAATSIYQTIEVQNDASRYDFSIWVRKSVGLTIFPAVQLSFDGNTCATPTYVTVAIDPNNGEAQEIDGNYATGAEPEISVIDEIDGYWKLSVIFGNNHQGNTFLTASIFPAACDASFTPSISLIAQIDIYNPVLFQTGLVSRNILDYSYILQLLNNLNDAWLNGDNFTDCGFTSPGIDGFRSDQLISPIDTKPEIGLIPITLTHRSIC